MFRKYLWVVIVALAMSSRAAMADPGGATSPAPTQAPLEVFEPSQWDDDSTNGYWSIILHEPSDTAGDYDSWVLTVEAPNGGLSIKERATDIANLLNKACQEDPQFYTDLVKQVIPREVYLHLPDSQLPIVTADQNWSRQSGTSDPGVFAEELISKLKTDLSGVRFRDAPLDFELTSTDAKNGRAQQYYDDAQAAWQAGHFDEAANKFVLAVNLNPAYSICWLKLGELYELPAFPDHDLSKARYYYQQALSDDQADAITQEQARAALARL